MSQTQVTPIENSRPSDPQVAPGIDDQLLDVLARFPGVVLAVLFGSVALGRQRPGSDLDIAVAARRALTVAEKIALVEALAERTGRPVDLIDLKVVAEPLLGQIVRHGRRLMGSDGAYGQLISRHLFEQADFMPYRSRVLAERRAAWTGK
jgi:predicted nucleotidyltransferase